MSEESNKELENILLYGTVPSLIVVGIISWGGAHRVSLILILIMTIMLPILYFIMYSERFDEYWLKKQEQQPKVESTLN